MESGAIRCYLLLSVSIRDLCGLQLLQLPTAERTMLPTTTLRRPILLTLLLTLILALSFQGGRGLWGPDEGRYSNIALQMVESGDWVTPRRHPDHTHFTKPPMIYWAIAASVQAFGKNEFALRLPNALSLFASVLLLIALGRRLVPAAPWLPGLIFATSLVPFAAANWINTDYLLTVFESLAVLGFVHLWRSQDARDARRGRALMWIGFALAFMTKGPPGLLPLLPILAFVYLPRTPAAKASLRPRIFSIGSLLLFALIAFPWYLTEIIKHPGLLDYFLVEEVYGRVFTDMHDRSSGRFGVFKVFGPLVLVGMLPWAWVLWRRLPGIWRQRRSLRAWWHTLAAEDQFLLLWCILPGIVFALATSKMPLYLLPLLVPTALLIARRLLPLDPMKIRRIMLCAGISALVMLLGKAMVPLIPHEKDARDLAQLVRKEFRPVPAQIVFIDESAQYGLRFYLGAHVGRVALASQMDFSFDSTLADELLQDESRVFITKRTRVEPLNAALLASGTRFHERAALGRYVIGTIGP